MIEHTIIVPLRDPPWHVVISNRPPEFHPVDRKDQGRLHPFMESPLHLRSRNQCWLCGLREHNPIHNVMIIDDPVVPEGPIRYTPPTVLKDGVANYGTSRVHQDDIVRRICEGAD